MIKCQFFIIAEKVIQEANTNNISIINVFDQISAPSFPVFFPTVAAVGSFYKEEADPDEIDVTFRVSINARPIIESSTKIMFTGSKKAHLIVNINGIPIQEPGALVVNITQNDGSALATFTIPVQTMADIVSFSGDANP